MLKVTIPRSRYDTTTYPNMNARAVGMVIPRIYGVVKNITPILINDTTSTYKISENALASLDAVRADGETLVAGTDYTADLANGEFSFDSGAPLIQAGQTYYMVWYGDYAIDPADYIWVCGKYPSQYAGGAFYSIDAGGAWTAVLEGADPVDADFKIWGRRSTGGSEELLIDNWNVGGSDYNGTLRDDAARTRVAQSFTAPAGADYYITRIQFKTRKIGAPAGDAWIEVHSDQVGTQVGGDSGVVDVSGIHPDGTVPQILGWDVINAEKIEADATGEYSIIDDVLDDLLQVVATVPAAKIDAAALAALGAAKTEVLSMYLNREYTFQDILARLEAGQLFKMIPDLAGTVTFNYYQAGTPAGTPHYAYKTTGAGLRKIKRGSLKVYSNPQAVKYKVVIKYNENPTDGTFSYAEATSDVARYVYRSEETVEIETFLSSSANAATLATAYSGLLEYPPLMIEFEAHDSGYDLLPTEKVSISSTRAPGATGGVLSEVLFRILRIDKRGDGSVAYTCQLDTQTY